MSYPGFGASGSRNIDMSRFVDLGDTGGGGALPTDLATRTETDLAQNIRKATSIGMCYESRPVTITVANKYGLNRGNSTEAYALALLQSPPTRPGLRRPG
jgi:hypothetical protein